MAFEFDFEGGYILPAHIHCYAVNEETYDATEVAYTLTGPNTVTLAFPVGEGYKLRIQRITPKDAPLVDYNGGAVVSEANLDKSNRQAILAAGEAVDAARLLEWRFENEVQGPKGDTGEDGTDGTNGVDGDTGPVGPPSVVDVKTYGALGNGVADDTAHIYDALAANDVIKIGKGTWRVSQIVVPAGKTIITEGYQTVLKQIPPVSGSASIVKITGSNVAIGSLVGMGNIATDTGEWNPVIEINANATTGNLSNIRIGDIVGIDIRGDVLETYSTDGYEISQLSVGHLYGDNILRTVAAVCTGKGVNIASVVGKRVGYMVLDFEPDGSCSPVIGAEVGYVKGHFAGVVGSDSTRYVEGIKIGTLDLDPAHNGGASSTPAYGFSVTDALLVRNCKSLTIDRFKANGFDGAAIRHMFSGVEIATQPIHIGSMEFTDCCKTEATLLSYVAGAAGVTRLTFDHYKVVITRATVSALRACYGVKGAIDATLSDDTRILHACDGADVGPIYTTTTGKGILVTGALNVVVRGGTVNVDTLSSYSNARFEGVTATATAAVSGDGSEAHMLPVLIDSTINGTYYALGIYGKCRMYRDGRVMATGFINTSGDQVVGARGAAIADAANAAAAPTKAEFDAFVAKYNTLLSRLRTHGLIAP